MKRTDANFIIDCLAFVGFTFLASSGVLLTYLLPPGSGSKLSIWGMSRHDWGDVHFYIAIAVLAVLALHLLLHWSWIAAVVKGRATYGTKYRVGLGLLAVLTLLALASAPLLSPIEQTAGAGAGQELATGGRASLSGYALSH